MERRRLKTVMILILALTNLFLALNLGRYRIEEAAARRRAEARLVDLLSADGILLDPALIPRDAPPDPVVLRRDEAAEAAVAHCFLTGDMAVFRQGGEWIYSAGTASARFLEDGSFAVTGLEVTEGAAELCGRFCREWNYRAAETWVSDSPVTVTALYGGAEVYNCTATFSFEEGVLRGVTGTLLPGGTPVAPDRALLSASGALTAFQSAYRHPERGEAVRLSELALCWAVQGGEVPALLPVWRITAGGTAYYVDCTDGSVSVG